MKLHDKWNLGIALLAVIPATLGMMDLYESRAMSEDWDGLLWGLICLWFLYQAFRKPRVAEVKSDAAVLSYKIPACHVRRQHPALHIVIPEIPSAGREGKGGVENGPSAILMPRIGRGVKARLTDLRSMVGREAIDESPQKSGAKQDQSRNN